ncbi:MAG: hypothetical protein II919_04440 [Lachnospiraceae bacterium]|nr:hypothetical protein [Lachnospiraceae bacterium]
MKITKKKKPVKTIPNGVWEASRPESDNTNDASHSNQKKGTFSPSTDLQGNGYPENKPAENTTEKNC